ncbi:MAG: hypothetical protein WC273_11190 [Dehalococcoidia bacterium]
MVGTVAIPATALAANASGVDVRSLAGAAINGQMRGGGDHGLAESAAPAHGGPMGPRADAHLAALAASLNVSVDTLKAAMQAARAEVQGDQPKSPADRQAFMDKYQAALAAKLNITVDALKAAEAANRPAPSLGPRQGPRQGAPGQHLEGLATALGVTPDALKAAWQAAATETKPATKPADAAAREAHRQAFVASLAAKLNLPVDKVTAALQQAKPTPPAKPTAAELRAMLAPRLAQMVQNGRITQAQADQILADIDAGKPVFEVLKQFMPQLGGHQGPAFKGSHGPGGPRGPQGAVA